MHEPARLAHMLAPYRARVAGVLGLEVVQQLAWIAEPFVFGRAIDALIEHHHHDRIGKLILHLTLWIAVFATNSVAGVVRHVYAERVHSSLYRDVCAALMKLGLRSSAQTASRAELFREVVVFLDERAPAVVAGAINVAGSVVALSLFDFRIALACSLVAVPVVIAQWIVEKRVSVLQREEHDLRERNVEVFATGDPAAVADHFGKASRARVRAAGWGAVSFGALRAFMLVIFVAVLFIAIDLDSFSTGAIYSIVAYLWTFVTYSEDIPMLLESRSSLRDLARRLDEQSVDAAQLRP